MLDQSTRLITLTTPLDDGVLVFKRMSAVEKLGRLFEYRVDMLSEDATVALSDILGKPMTVTLELPDGSERFFHGLVTRFTQVPHRGQTAHYRAVLRPWLWFLTRTADCRIFQNLTVPDIIKEVFRQYGFSDFEDRLSGNYRTWVYCVQYRETAYNFVARLMEQEGIYFYFVHEDSKHTLVLADGSSAHETAEGYAEVPYFPPENMDRRERDHVYEWFHSQEVQPSTVVLDEFDFENPSGDLQVTHMYVREHENADHEVYDYPGEYKVRGDGETYAGVRIEELQAQFETRRGSANARGLAVGNLFTLTDFPRDDQNLEYLIVEANYELESDAFETGSGDSGEIFTCGFTALDTSNVYRSPRITPKPVVQGPQTAVVTGPPGEEIHTDEYGRVSLKFPWDRHGPEDQNSSCMVRVAQVWAGQNWGAMHIPRIGQEVIVEHLEGDPDRPIVTGRVYNAENMPPYDLDANKTQSGIKSRSSKGGGPDNFNELRFEDKIGEEEIYMHAEKLQTNIIEADHEHHVGGNRNRTVGSNEKEDIGANKTIDVGANHKETIGAAREVKVGSTDKLTVGASRTITVGASESKKIAAACKRVVGATDTTTVAASSTTTVGGMTEFTVGGAWKEMVAASKHESKAGAFSEFTGGIKAEQILGLSTSVHGGVKIELFAGAQISTASGIKVEKGPAKEWDFPGCTIKAGRMDIDGATVEITGGSIVLKGPVKIDGDLDVTGYIKNGSINAP